MKFQASFKNESLILKWKDDSNESLIFILFYKHEKNGNWRDVVLKNVCKNDISSEYRVEYTVPNVQAGRYICQIQSTCEFGVSEMSEEIFVYKEEEVSSVFLFRATPKRIQNPIKHLGSGVLEKQLIVNYLCKKFHLGCLTGMLRFCIAVESLDLFTTDFFPTKIITSEYV